jgi:coenzyme F420-0:L-glutamate ligase/coenzyme F420-1:gamma-L-glutamate ligase
MTAPIDASPPDPSPRERTFCDERLELRALPGLPLIRKGDDLAALIGKSLAQAEIVLRDSDILAVTSKILSRAEGRFVDLGTVEVSARAEKLAAEVGKDPRLVELILRESIQISRQAPGVLVVRHRLGFISAHASIDCSNAVPVGAPKDSGPWALLLPTDPDQDAERIRQALEAQSGARLGIVITDSLGRPFRLGTVGAAIGVAGMPALWDRRGEADIYGRKLEHTITALADQVAAVTDLVAGQAAEGRPVVHVRGLHFPTGPHRATELYRPQNEDLYA